jgi:hypothetical protein
LNQTLSLFDRRTEILPRCRREPVLGIHDLWLFILSGLLLNITPGPDTAYIVGRSLQMGWHGGAAAAIGIGCGCLVHVFGAAIGLSALLMASSAAFSLVKWIGAAYLCFLGIKLLLSRTPAADATSGDVRICAAVGSKADVSSHCFRLCAVAKAEALTQQRHDRLPAANGRSSYSL